jgi:hypothetical protein
MNQQPPTHSEFSRIGFHYYPDYRHYRRADLDTWLPRLIELGASWLTLLAPAERAIPEDFIRGLLSADLQPVLHFCLSPARPPALDTLGLLFNVYARWGIRYVAFYHQPNARGSWPGHLWAQSNLVERFLDDFIPVAQLAQERDLTVITPPLAPGGDYWDLAFLRAELKGLKRRGSAKLLDSLAIGAYAWIENRPLDWGAGGPERWPDALPYHPSDAQQDHLGFCIFDWYLTICQEELGYRPPIFLLRAGQRSACDSSAQQDSTGKYQHARQNLLAARWVSGEVGPDLPDRMAPAEIKACNFWLLAAEPGDPHAADSWYSPQGERLPVVDAFRQWAANLRKDQAPAFRGRSEEANCLPDKADQDAPHPAHCSGGVACQDLGEEAISPSAEQALERQLDVVEPAVGRSHPINHYILLPLYAWGAANWDLALVETLLEESHPAIGFSLAEARLAKHVTVVGAEGAISEDALAMLRQSGCQVERLLEDGTLIAT